jgi:hypothetical protein
MSFKYTYIKNINIDKLNSELKLYMSAKYSHINYSNTSIDIFFSLELTSSEKEQLDTLVQNHSPINMTEIVKNTVKNATSFGSELMIDFATENVLMGIAQDGMTSTVRKNMEQVILALTTGSLYDAITEAKSIPSEKKDYKYITDVRLLNFINKIEDYLGIPRSTTL